MNDRKYVACHAPSLALLLFENVCSRRDQKGLLLGVVKTHIVTSITDANETNEEEKTVIYIEHCVPILDETVIGPYGEIDENFHQTYCKTYKEKIIGWYSYRSNMKPPCISLKDSFFHKSLLNVFDHIPQDVFLLAQLSSSIHPSLSTHSFNQSFYILNSSQSFKKIRFKIYSLSDKMANSSGYLRNVSLPMSSTFEKIVQSSGQNDDRMQWVNRVHHLVKESLQSLSQRLLDTENRRCSLEKEVSKLKNIAYPKPSVIDVPEKPVENKDDMVPRFLKYDPSFSYSKGRENPIVVSSTEEDEVFAQAEVAMSTSTEEEQHARQLADSLSTSEGVLNRVAALTSQSQPMSYASMASSSRTPAKSKTPPPQVPVETHTANEYYMDTMNTNER